ncbi:hypothetical protein D6C97_07570 [Aureobasidium pullulans]|uniref:F-box domain-containing protein n=1 Tax=Aureobasidium pullulans TaxID=5580 RepID=A0A4S8XLF5_AURPU|nr:hypothetical protein D6D22_06141 [Aureobasidium pullulans]THY48685.1 hypothetical protein D6C97_07570 [Aureobasidium pullulans]
MTDCKLRLSYILKQALLHRRRKTKLPVRIQDLPIDVILCILDFLDPVDRTLFAYTCKAFRADPIIKHSCGDCFGVKTRTLQLIRIYGCEWCSPGRWAILGRKIDWQTKLLDGSMLVFPEAMLDAIAMTMSKRLLQPACLARSFLLDVRYPNFKKSLLRDPVFIYTVLPFLLSSLGWVLVVAWQKRTRVKKVVLKSGRKLLFLIAMQVHMISPSEDYSHDKWLTLPVCLKHLKSAHRIVYSSNDPFDESGHE